MGMIVVTTEPLTWRIDGATRVMPASTRLEVLPWSEQEQDIRGGKDRRRLFGFLPTTWLDGRRWVPVSTLEATNQETARLLKDERARARRVRDEEKVA